MVCDCCILLFGIYSGINIAINQVIQPSVPLWFSLPEQCVPFPLQPLLHQHCLCSSREEPLQKAFGSQTTPSHDPSAGTFKRVSEYRGVSKYIMCKARYSLTLFLAGITHRPIIVYFLLFSYHTHRTSIK